MSRRCSASTALTNRKRPPARHGCTCSCSSCTAAGGRTNTPSGSTCAERTAQSESLWGEGLSGGSTSADLRQIEKKKSRERETAAKKRTDLIGREGKKGRASGLQAAVLLKGVKDGDDRETEGSGFSATPPQSPLLFNLLCEERGKKNQSKHNRSYILLCEAPLMPFLGELTC